MRRTQQVAKLDGLLLQPFWGIGRELGSHLAVIALGMGPDRGEFLRRVQWKARSLKLERRIEWRVLVVVRECVRELRERQDYSFWE